MRIERQQDGGGVIFRPSGPLAGTEAEQLARQASRAVEDGARALVVDVSQVPHADSRGLEVLLEVTERLIRTGEALTLAGASPELREALELTELDTLFTYADVPPAPEPGEGVAP